MNTFERQIVSCKSGEILDRVKLVFARKGFEGASMQELAQAAQMSVGNFYRYFPSKDAIITALVHRDLEDMQSEFNAAHRSDDKAGAYLALARQHLTCTTPDEAALWSEIEAAAFRNPEIAKIRDQLELAIRDTLTAAMRSIDEPDNPRSEDDLVKTAEIIILLVKGLAKKRGFAVSQGFVRGEDGVAEYGMEVIRDLFAASPSEKS